MLNHGRLLQPQFVRNAMSNLTLRFLALFIKRRSAYVSVLIIMVLGTPTVAAGQDITVLQGHPGKVRVVAFSPDGTMLAAGSGVTITLWDVASRQQIATLEGHTGKVWSVAFSPGGETLASGGQDTTVRLWDIASREEIITLRAHEHWVLSVDFSPDGTTVASAERDVRRHHGSDLVYAGIRAGR